MTRSLLVTDSDLNATLVHHGVAVVQGVRLAPLFHPRTVDLALIRCPNRSVEVYVPQALEYRGTDTELRRAMQGPVISDARRIYTDTGTAAEVVAQFLAQFAGTRTPMSPAELTDLPAVTAQADRPAAPDASAIFDGLSARVRGQDAALRSLSNAVARHLGKAEPRRPLTALLTGPTGVGKTKSAEVLRAVLTELGLPRHFVRIDCNELVESHSTSRLLGAPPSYAGYGSGTTLSDEIRRHPNAIVLFDEIEKAHANVLRTLMNFIDAGRLASSTGATSAVDGRQCIVLFTSNVASNRIIEQLVELDAYVEPHAVTAVVRQALLESGLPPELVGRIGTLLAFQPLTPEARAEIMALAVVACATDYGVTVRWIEPSVLSALLSQAAASPLGARPDEQLVEEHLGEVFAAAATEFRKEAVAISGPPFMCTLYESEE